MMKSMRLAVIMAMNIATVTVGVGLVTSQNAARKAQIDRLKDACTDRTYFQYHWIEDLTNLRIGGYQPDGLHSEVANSTNRSPDGPIGIDHMILVSSLPNRHLLEQVVRYRAIAVQHGMGSRNVYVILRPGSNRIAVGASAFLAEMLEQSLGSVCLVDEIGEWMDCPPLPAYFVVLASADGKINYLSQTLSPCRLEQYLQGLVGPPLD